jgi:hypothetical protein
MKNTHPAFWGAAWAGVAVGGALTLFGLTSLGDVASLAGGYGLMLMGTALFALAGLKLRKRLMERAESRRVRRIALARLPQRPATTTFGEQSPASVSAPATANRTS